MKYKKIIVVALLSCVSVAANAQQAVIDATTEFATTETWVENKLQRVMEVARTASAVLEGISNVRETIEITKSIKKNMQILIDDIRESDVKVDFDSQLDAIQADLSFCTEMLEKVVKAKQGGNLNERAALLTEIRRSLRDIDRQICELDYYVCNLNYQYAKKKYTMETYYSSRSLGWSRYDNNRK